MRYNILDGVDGNVINTIKASAEFVEANFDHFELWAAAEPTAAAEARQWRDIELSSTDIAATVSDWPNRDNILTYRTALRDWPSTEDFPDTRPVLGS